jgi:hypothetical protein
MTDSPGSWYLGRGCFASPGEDNAHSADNVCVHIAEMEDLDVEPRAVAPKRYSTVLMIGTSTFFQSRSSGVGTPNA